MILVKTDGFIQTTYSCKCPTVIYIIPHFALLVNRSSGYGFPEHCYRTASRDPCRSYCHEEYWPKENILCTLRCVLKLLQCYGTFMLELF